MNLKRGTLFGRCSKGDSVPVGSGFPIGASGALLAHDFLESLVCYTFGGASGEKGELWALRFR